MITKILEPRKARYSEHGDKRFGDILEEFSRELIDQRMYVHQERCVRAIGEGKHVILCSGTGSGKTEAVAAALLKNYKAKEDKPLQALFLYPTKVLTHQQRERFNKIFGRSQICIYDGDNERRHLEVKRRPMVFSNPHMCFEIIKHKTKLFEKYGMNIRFLIFDEIHMYNLYQLALIGHIIRECKKRNESVQIILLSATIEDTDKLKNSFVKAIGPGCEGRIAIIQEERLSLGGRNKKIIQLKKERELLIYERSEIKEEDFNALLAERIKGLHEQIQLEDHVTLVFCSTTMECDRLYTLCKGKQVLDSGYEIMRHHSRVSQDDRKEIEKDLMEEKKSRIVFSVKTLAQGIDIKDILQVIHVGIPARSMDFVQREGRMGRVGPNESKDNEETCRSVLIMLEDLGHPLDLKFIHDFRDIDKADGEDENDIEELFSRLEKIESIQIISDSEIQKFFSDQPSIFRKNILEIDEYLAEYGSPIKQTLTQLGRLFFSYVSFYGHGPVLNVIEKIDKYSSKHLKKVSLYEAMDSLLPGAVFTWQKKRYVVQKWYNWSLLLTASFYDRGIIFVEKLENIEEKYQKLHEYKKIHSKTTWKNIAFESREGLFGELKFQSLQIRILNSENGEEIDKKSCEWNPFIKPILTYCIEASVPGTIEEGHHFCHSIIHALWEIESLAMDEFGHLVMDLGKGIIKILFYENEPSGILERISWEGILDRAGALFMEPWDALRVPFCYLKVNEVFQPVKEDYQNLKRSFYENILSLIDR